MTVCAHNMECLFGSVGSDGQVTLNEHGQAVHACWLAIPEHFPTVAIDASVTMPNHLHGILILRDANEGDACVAPTNVGSGARGPRRRSIGVIVGSFKSAVTKRINEMRGTREAVVWQRNYYEHIIRDEDDLRRVRRYIESNPLRWAMKYNRQGDACVAPTNVLSKTNMPARRRE